jgi:phenylacetic acid degradation operon negative regulatory protein
MTVNVEGFLWVMLWTCDSLLFPSWRSFGESFEGWAYRRGSLARIRRLEQERLIERRDAENGRRREWRITPAGRLRALGGRDPVACWNSLWDGQWRLVIFDIAERRRVERNLLRHQLRRRGFGCLQDSVWITPHPLDEERARLAGELADVKALLLLDARSGSETTAAQIVSAAWNFTAINARYAAHRRVLDQRPRGALDTATAGNAFAAWLREECARWTEAIAPDPLLPESLWPRGYAGRDAWQRRTAVMSEAGRQMRAFAPPPGP